MGKVIRVAVVMLAMATVACLAVGCEAKTEGEGGETQVTGAQPTGTAATGGPQIDRKRGMPPDGFEEQASRDRPEKLKEMMPDFEPLNNQPFSGDGWVTSAKQGSGGGWVLSIDFDAPGTKEDGPEITEATVDRREAKGEMPSVGDKVYVYGWMSNIQRGENPTLEVHHATVQVLSTE